ncbi:hypothetical protein AVEN_250058-1 [Araneus ventricosus]|uniref:Uncharacterized protein n=1 Tax=Araneus ventricosus TaxID=182803 RepID=A0A4Y2DKH4_ARAVE|nr:hypothetical protein AVEN_250058-1 [Araneus ventricosus]
MRKEDLRQVVDGVLQRNGFFAHEENLLLLLNFNANDYIGMIDWNEPKSKRYEPALTKILPETEIETIAKTDKAPDTPFQGSLTFTGNGKLR